MSLLCVPNCKYSHRFYLVTKYVASIGFVVFGFQNINIPINVVVFGSNLLIFPFGLAVFGLQHVNMSIGLFVVVCLWWV